MAGSVEDAWSDYRAAVAATSTSDSRDNLMHVIAEAPADEHFAAIESASEALGFSAANDLNNDTADDDQRALASLQLLGGAAVDLNQAAVAFLHAVPDETGEETLLAAPALQTRPGRLLTPGELAEIDQIMRWPTAYATDFFAGATRD